jgi:hypothetical protein
LAHGKKKIIETVAERQFVESQKKPARRLVKAEQVDEYPKKPKLKSAVGF